MTDQEIKKRSRGILSLWLIIAAAVAGGTYLLCAHSGNKNVSPLDTSPMMMNSTTTDLDADIATNTQAFSGNGYTFNVPADWYIEKSGDDSVAVYPDHSSTSSSATATCKIEMSTFSYSSNVSAADWISGRIGADPSLAIVERSSADVPIAGGSGVQWNGTIDDVPTILVYAFGADHAYEIAPSVVNEQTAGNVQCQGALDTFLSQLILN
jgi:hypothetical protein